METGLDEFMKEQGFNKVVASGPRKSNSPAKG